jgi:hypothetical protein
MANPAARVRVLQVESLRLLVWCCGFSDACSGARPGLLSYDHRDIDGVAHRGVAGPVRVQLVAGSSVTTSKSITPSKMPALRMNWFYSWRFASTSGVPWVGVLFSAPVSVAM